MVDVVYPAGWFHVERDRVELFGMVHERIDQLPLTTADADTIVRTDHKHRRFRLEFLQELRALFEEWLHSISESRIGRKRADELSARLLEVMPG